MRTVWDIIKSPVITEKALAAKEETQDTRQLLSFRVDRRATKPEIKSAVETIFQVKVDHVRTINFMGKMARRGRFEGRKPSWKKAYVTLKQGRSEEHTSELQSQFHLVCRLLLEKKKDKIQQNHMI